MGERIDFEKDSQKRLFTLSLAMPSFVIALSNLILNLLLLEIASTLQIHEGVAVQLRTAGSVAEIAFGLIIGLLSTHFKHKLLLMTGALLIIVSAVGNFLASSFNMLLFFFFLEGAGSVIVSVMAITLAGDLLNLKKKTKAISWITAAGFIAVFIGTLTITYVVSLSGWRYTFLLIVLPFSILALVLAFLGIPFLKSSSQQSTTYKGIDFSHYKQIFSNKSAVKCLLGNLFFTGAGSTIFIIAFIRQKFSISLEDFVYINLIATVIIILGSLSTGQIGNRFGVKTLTVAGSVMSGFLLLFLFFAPNLGVAVAFYFSSVWFLGITVSSSTCFVLDQVPKSRSIVISLSRFFNALNGLIVPAIGGLLLVLFSAQSNWNGYQSIGIMLSAMNIFAGILYFSAKI